MSFFPEDTQKDFRDILKSLEGKHVAVLGHLRPDADCIGSQIALVRTLNTLGIQAVALNYHSTPRAIEPFVKDTPWALAEQFDAKGWTAVAVDCADNTRFGPHVNALFPEIFVNIDHHRSNTLYARTNLNCEKAAATAVVLGGLFIDCGIGIDAVTAQALYIGIATDTGMFRYPSTTPRVFQLCAELMRHGASPHLAAQHLFENEPYEKIVLLRRFLKTLQFGFDGRLCYGELPYGIFDETGTLKEDAEGFVDYARDIAGVEIGLLLEAYEPDRTKGSLRAKSEALRMDLLAAKLNGGGHAAAAGFNINEPLETVREIVLIAIKEHLEAYEAGEFE